VGRIKRVLKYLAVDIQRSDVECVVLNALRVEGFFCSLKKWRSKDNALEFVSGQPGMDKQCGVRLYRLSSLKEVSSRGVTGNKRDFYGVVLQVMSGELNVIESSD
jgi:hypothetical protein